MAPASEVVPEGAQIPNVLEVTTPIHSQGIPQRRLHHPAPGGVESVNDDTEVDYILETGQVRKLPEGPGTQENQVMRIRVPGILHGRLWQFPHVFEGKTYLADSISSGSYRRPLLEQYMEAVNKGRLYGVNHKDLHGQC